MKKLCKFLFGTLSLAAIAGGIYYFYKKYVNKDSSHDFDDFDDDFDDVDAASSETTDNREYVSIHITTDPDSEADNDLNEDTK